MRKTFIMLALCITAAFAYADQVTDAIRTFYAKGGCIEFEISIDAKKEGSGTFSLFVNKSMFDEEPIVRIKGTFDGETGDLLMFGEAGEISMKYIKSITNDTNGNLIITTRTLTAADLENDDMGGLLRSMLEEIF
ncbi:MAG: hypothetical protein J1E07_10215 [Treponema sp.]|nr:hypothetical protein [Treponema sp.]